MDRSSASEYTQPGLITPFPTHADSIHSPDNTRAEASSLDHASGAQYVTQQEVRPSNYSTAATPTPEYGVYPSSARSGSFAEHIQRPYQASPGHPGNAAAMAQNPGSLYYSFSPLRPRSPPSSVPLLTVFHRPFHRGLEPDICDAQPVLAVCTPVTRNAARLPPQRWPLRTAPSRLDWL